MTCFFRSQLFNIIYFAHDSLHMCVLLMDFDLHWSKKKRYALKFTVYRLIAVLLQFPTYSGECDCFAPAAAHCQILPSSSSMIAKNNPKSRPGNLLDIFQSRPGTVEAVLESSLSDWLTIIEFLKLTYLLLLFCLLCLVIFYFYLIL